MADGAGPGRQGRGARTPDRGGDSRGQGRYRRPPAVREAAIAAHAAVHASYRRFRALLVEAGFDRPEPVATAAIAGAIPVGGALVMPVTPSSGTGHALVLAAGAERPEVLPLPGVTGDWLTSQLRRWFEGYAAFQGSIEKTGRVDTTEVAAWNRAISEVLIEAGLRLMARSTAFCAR